MNANFSRWTSPILGEGAKNAYSNVYGESAKCFMDILESSPYEIAVISRMITYLGEKKRGEK